MFVQCYFMLKNKYWSIYCYWKISKLVSISKIQTGLWWVLGAIITDTTKGQIHGNEIEVVIMDSFKINYCTKPARLCSLPWTVEGSVSVRGKLLSHMAPGYCQRNQVCTQSGVALSDMYHTTGDGPFQTRRAWWKRRTYPYKDGWWVPTSHLVPETAQ